MDEFLDEEENKKSQKETNPARGYGRVFVLVFAIAMLWQVVGFIQMQLAQYHEGIVKEVKIVMPVVADLDNESLNAIGESLNSKTDVRSVKLFSAQDGLAALQQRNPRLTQALIALGKEQMPSYFELHLTDRAINNIRPFAQNLAAEYPQLAVKYSPEQADMAFWSGLCIRTINAAAILALVLFVCFMFMVEAYPVHGKSHSGRAVWWALLAGVLSFAVLAAAIYPTGLLMKALAGFTSIGRQVGLLVFCGLLGWTLGKWQKF